MASKRSRGLVKTKLLCAHSSTLAEYWSSRDGHGEELSGSHQRIAYARFRGVSAVLHSH